MFDVLKDVTQIHSNKEVSVELEADTLDQLFIKWLDELNYASQTEDMLYSKFDVKLKQSNNRWTLKATLGGDSLSNYDELGPEIKAVTLHQFEFGEQNGLKYCQVILDI